MGKRARTKDESFMVCLHEQTLKKAQSVEEEDVVFDRYEIGQLVGLQAKAVDTICVLLCQANFIKKKNDNEVFITPHGIKLVDQILND